MTYVLPTAPNMCSYTTLAKMNCQISTCWTSGRPTCAAGSVVWPSNVDIA